MGSTAHNQQFRSIPPPARRGLNRVEAAAYIGVSATTFDGLVRDCQMPKAKHVGARRIWDVRAVDKAFDLLGCADSDANPWD